MKGYIYILTCPITNLVRYIGQTINPERRYAQHCYLNNKNGKFHHLNWLKFLKNKNLKPIMTVIDETEINNLNFLEIFYIDLFKSWGFDLTNTSRKEYFRVHRQHFSSGKLIYCYTNDYTLQVFKNARECEKILKIGYKRISKYCKENAGVIFKKYIFSFTPLTNEEVDKKFNNSTRGRKNILGIIGTNNLTKEQIIFKNQKEAAIKLNVNFRNINQVLKGLRKSCGGYTWKYDI